MWKRADLWYVKSTATNALNDNTLVRTIVSSFSVIATLIDRRRSRESTWFLLLGGSQGRWHYTPFNCRRMRGEPARFSALGVSSHAFHANEIASWIKQRGPRGIWNEFTGAHAYVYAVTPIQDHHPTRYRRRCRGRSRIPLLHHPWSNERNHGRAKSQSPSNRESLLSLFSSYLTGGELNPFRN